MSPKIKKNLENSIENKKETFVDYDNESEKQLLREQTTFHWIKITATIIFSILLIVIFAIYTLHFLIPEEKRWLSMEDLERIKSIAVAVASGVFSSITTSYFFNNRNRK